MKNLELSTDKDNKIETFDIKDKDGNDITLSIYPLQLARLSMISQKLRALNIDLDKMTEADENQSLNQMVEICAEKPRAVAEIIAIATLRTKKDIDEKLTERTDLIYWSPTSGNCKVLATLLEYVVMLCYDESFMDALKAVRVLRVNIGRETEPQE